MAKNLAELTPKENHMPKRTPVTIRALPLLPDGDDTEVRHIADA